MLILFLTFLFTHASKAFAGDLNLVSPFSDFVKKTGPDKNDQLRYALLTEPALIKFSSFK